MKNVIAYYYGLHINEMMHKDNRYIFECNNNKYVFEVFKRPIEDVDALYKINKEMINNNVLMHEIILNKENKILTYVNNTPYILMEIFINEKARINLADICHINNNAININCDKILERSDWITLWEAKNDYFESQITEVGAKYPNLSCYVNYYIGLAENAISYIRNILNINDIVIKSLCHKRIDSNSTLFYLYHPMNLICDYKVRDVAEYIKSSFFNNYDSYFITIQYFKNNYLSYKEALLFYGRLLYPSYFFDMYDDIVNNNLNEDKIEKIIEKAQEYEVFLCKIHALLTNIYNTYIPQVDWLIKKDFYY